MIKRRTFLKMMGSTLLGPTLPYQILAKNIPVSQPNILIILADDLGFNDLSCQGSKDILTPNIDSIAESGMSFTDAHPTASVCSPSRAGLLTGRYQQRFGHESNSPPKGFGMDVDEKTLGDSLSSLGYRTGIVGKWHVGSGEKHYPNGNQAIEYNGKQVIFEGYRRGFD